MIVYNLHTQDIINNPIKQLNDAYTKNCQLHLENYSLKLG